MEDLYVFVLLIQHLNKNCHMVFLVWSSIVSEKALFIRHFLSIFDFMLSHMVAAAIGTESRIERLLLLLRT